MELIQSITEAFSMQPQSLRVFSQQEYETFYSKETATKEIKKDVVRIDGEPTEVYVGYNFEGKKIFQYLAKSVNVHYFP